MKTKHFARWFVITLVALLSGVGTFRYVRSQPLCMIVDREEVFKLSPDGSRLLTYHNNLENPNADAWRVWDTRTGQKLHEWKADLLNERWVLSNDCRHVAKGYLPNKVKLIDWTANEEWDFEARAETDTPDDIYFSDDGRWLICNSLFCVDVVNARKFELPITDWCATHVDNSIMLLRESDEKKAIVWDLVKNQKLGELPFQSLTHQRCQNGLLARTWSVGGLQPFLEEDEAGRKLCHYKHVDLVGSFVEVWNLSDCKRTLAREYRKSPKVNVLFSKSAAFIAVWGGKSDLEVIRTSDGKTLWSVPNVIVDSVEFSPCDDFFLVRHSAWHGEKGQRLRTMYATQTGETLWELHDGPDRFSGRSTVVKTDPDSPLRFLDARTAMQIGTGPSDIHPAMGEWLQFSTDGRRVLLQGTTKKSEFPELMRDWPQKIGLDLGFGEEVSCVSVLDSASGKELFRMMRSTSTSLISTDGETVITTDPAPGDRGRMISAWDVRPNWAWTMAIAVALTVALVGGAVLFFVFPPKKVNL